jgi:hypothetical protein
MDNNDWRWIDGDATVDNLRDTVMTNMTDVTIADDGDEVGVLTAQRLVNELDTAYATAIESIAEALNDDVISWEMYSEIYTIVSDYLNTTRKQLMRIISRD